MCSQSCADAVYLYIIISFSDRVLDESENNLDETSRREIESVLEESIFQDKNKEEAQNVDMKTRVYVEMYDDKGTEYMEWVPLQLDVAWLLDNKPTLAGKVTHIPNPL